MSETPGLDVTSEDSFPEGVTTLLTVLACDLPKGYLGFYRQYNAERAARSGFREGDHVIRVHRLCSRQQRVETILHELFHFLLGHTDEMLAGVREQQWEAQHAVIEDLCARTAAQLLAIPVLPVETGPAAHALAARARGGRP